MAVRSLLVVVVCTMLASCGHDRTGVAPSEKTRLIAGDYAVSLAGPLPAGCYLSQLQIIFGGPNSLAQHSADVALSASGFLSSLSLTGHVTGENVTVTVNYEGFNPAAGSTSIVGGGIAAIRPDGISGLIDADIVNIGRQFSPVTTSCHTTGLSISLSRSVSR